MTSEMIVGLLKMIAGLSLAIGSVIFGYKMIVAAIKSSKDKPDFPKTPEQDYSNQPVFIVSQAIRPSATNVSNPIQEEVATVCQMHGNTIAPDQFVILRGRTMLSGITNQSTLNNPSLGTLQVYGLFTDVSESPSVDSVGPGTNEVYVFTVPNSLQLQQLNEPQNWPNRMLVLEVK